MTTNMTSRIATAELERIAADLTEARADVALLERLKSANDRVTRLSAEQDKAMKARDKALAAEAKEQDAKLFASISDVSVMDLSPDENVVRASFTIKYTKPAWNGRTSRPKEHVVEGFASLPSDVFEYIIEKRPELIPARIMALAPDCPRMAFNRYFVSRKRGWVAG